MLEKVRVTSFDGSANFHKTGNCQITSEQLQISILEKIAL